MVTIANNSSKQCRLLDNELLIVFVVSFSIRLSTAVSV